MAFWTITWLDDFKIKDNEPSNNHLFDHVKFLITFNVVHLTFTQQHDWYSLHSSNASEFGFVLVLDRRRDKWASLRGVLVRLAVSRQTLYWLSRKICNGFLFRPVTIFRLSLFCSNTLKCQTNLKFYRKRGWLCKQIAQPCYLTGINGKRSNEYKNMNEKQLLPSFFKISYDLACNV